MAHPLPRLRLDLSRRKSGQQRLLSEMRTADVEVVIATLPEHVQWLVGVRFGWVHQASAALFADGHALLVAPDREPTSAAADSIVTYEAKRHSTLRNDQPRACHEALWNAAGDRLRGRTVGVEFSRFGHYWSDRIDRVVDVEQTFYQLRRRKDADELALIGKAIAGTARMYERAREIIEPGISEIEVFNQLQAAAAEEFGEMLTATGNDYRCAARGGPPRGDRLAAEGELYILDLGPAYRGYFADNARTIAVSRPTDAQYEAWTHVLRALEHVERAVKPGKSAKAVFEEVQQLLDEAPVGVFDHHLGHGFGLFPHEAPHLNPYWDDTFEEGEVFTAEPGLYAAELNAGIRLENDYLVTRQGVELLTDFDPRLKSS